jgi:hypothetical protein
LGIRQGSTSPQTPSPNSYQIRLLKKIFKDCLLTSPPGLLSASQRGGTRQSPFEEQSVGFGISWGGDSLTGRIDGREMMPNLTPLIPLKLRREGEVKYREPGRERSRIKVSPPQPNSERGRRISLRRCYQAPRRNKFDVLLGVVDSPRLADDLDFDLAGILHRFLDLLGDIAGQPQC